MDARHLRWQPDAVIVALEDVLLDTRLARCSTWRWWARRTGLDPDLVVELAWGRSPRDVVRELVPDRDPDEEVTELAAREHLLLKTARRGRGAWNLVRSLPEGRWGVLSSGTAEQAQERWRRTRLPPPPLLVTDDDLAVGRPAPEGHRAVATALATVPERCVALEGSPAGVAGAVAAGATAILVHGGIDRIVPPGVAAVVHSLSSLTIDLTADGPVLSTRRESPRGW